VTYPNKKRWRIDLIVMDDLPRKKNDGLIVMGDLPKGKKRKNGLIIMGERMVSL